MISMKDRRRRGYYILKRRAEYLSGGVASTVLNLSASSIAEDASVGDLVGTFSVTGGSGSYTFSLTDDGGGLFAVDGVDTSRLEVAAALSAGSVSITASADNGVDPPISRAFLITVTAVSGSSELLADTGQPILADTGSPILVQ